MELDVFMKVLESSLVKHGVPSDMAGQHAATLRTTFTQGDLADIENIRSEAEVDSIAAGIASILNKHKPAKPAEAPKPSHVGEMYTENDAPRPMKANTSSVRPAQNSADFFEDPDGSDRTPKGTAVFWGVLILTLPITLALLGLVLGAFAFLYIALIAGIIGFILALIGVAACGGGIALVGMIYGVTQLFSNVPAGIYEIGLGVIIAGASVFIAVLLYNAAVRFLPWVMHWLTVFFGFVMDRIKYGFCLARRECYKL